MTRDLLVSTGGTVGHVVGAKTRGAARARPPADAVRSMIDRWGWLPDGVDLAAVWAWAVSRCLPLSAGEAAWLLGCSEDSARALARRRGWETSDPRRTFGAGAAADWTADRVQLVLDERAEAAKPSADDDRPLSLSEAARLLRVSRTRVARLRDTGRLKRFDEGPHLSEQSVLAEVARRAQLRQAGGGGSSSLTSSASTDPSASTRPATTSAVPEPTTDDKEPHSRGKRTT